MIDSIRQFIFDSLEEMDCDIEDIDDNSQLGPRGADLSSLSLAELALRVEDEYGIRFGEEETEKLAGLTVAQFCAVVAGRSAMVNATGE
jgi:acyl carrier protein